jgi:signal transduction histidine kinase
VQQLLQASTEKPATQAPPAPPETQWSTAHGRATTGASAQNDLRSFNRWLCVTRLRASVAVVVFILVLRVLGIGTLAVGPITAVCAGLCLFSYVGLRWPSVSRSPRLFLHLQNLIDLAAVTIALSLAQAGLVTLLLRSIYVLVIIPASLISIPTGLIVAGFASAGHFFLLALERELSLATVLSIEGLLPVFLFFLVAQQAFFYGTHLESKNAALSQLASSLGESRVRLAALVDVARTLNSTLQPSQLLPRVNRAALQHLGADWSATFLVDGDRDTFRIAALSDVDVKGSELDRVEFPTDSWPALRRIAGERVIALAGSDAEEVSPLLTGGRRFTTMFLAGLYREHTLIGLLALGYRGGDTPPRETVLEQLAAIADHAAIALRNAQLLEDARQASALKSEFLSMVSHELRTPLNVITGFTEMLRDGAAGPLSSEQRELLERIDVRGRELFDLIEATLHVGRIETGRDGVTLAPVPLADLVHSLKINTAGLPRPQTVAFEWHLPDRPRGIIITDRAKVALVVRNLVSNAFKFTPHGSVAVHLLPGQSTLTLVVRDTGVGIPPEQVPLIFEMFRQLENGLTRQHGGVGLGLYIVKQVVDRLGGRISVNSAPGCGTTFSVTLNHYHPDADSDPTLVTSEEDGSPLLPRLVAGA